MKEENVRLLGHGAYVRVSNLPYINLTASRAGGERSGRGCRLNLAYAFHLNHAARKNFLPIFNVRCVAT